MRAARPAPLSINEAVQLIQRWGVAYFWISGMPVILARGHITDALHIPAGLSADRCASWKVFRDKPIVVVCKMGQSAGPATKTLRAQGFDRAQKLSGGMMEWDAQKLPVVTDE